MNAIKPCIEPYSTHLPLLTACVARSEGLLAPPVVIELGCGYYSTPVLRALCSSLGGSLISYETDREWLNKVYTPGHSVHKAVVLDSWQDLDRYGEELCCDVAFVDAVPAEDRRRIVDVMRRWANIIVVHDTETEQDHVYNIRDLLATFQYQAMDRRRGPWTTAVSDEVDLSKIQEAVA